MLIARLHCKGNSFYLKKAIALVLWLPTINDLRTCLAKDPLPLETVRDLLTA